MRTYSGLKQRNSKYANERQQGRNEARNKKTLHCIEGLYSNVTLKHLERAFNSNLHGK